MWAAAVHSLTGSAKLSNLKHSYYFPKAWHSECSHPDFHYFHFRGLEALGLCSNQTFPFYFFFFFYLFNSTQLLFASEAKERHKVCTLSQVPLGPFSIHSMSKSGYFLFIHDVIHRTHLLMTLRNFPSSFRKTLFSVIHNVLVFFFLNLW